MLCRVRESTLAGPSRIAKLEDYAGWQTPPGKHWGNRAGQGEGYLRDSTVLTNQVQQLFIGCGITTTVDREKGGRKAVEVGFHSLRHFAATMMMEGNVPQAVAQAMIGHASPALLATYQHVGAGQIRSAIKQIAAQADGTATVSESDADKLAKFRRLAETMTAKNGRVVKAELLAIA